MAKWKRKSLKLAPVGERIVHVVSAEEKKANNGADMIVLSLKVDQIDVTFKEWIIIAESWEKKIAAFLSAFGETLPDEADIIPENYIGRTARVEVGVRTDNKYRTFNKVVRWLPAEMVGEPETIGQEAAS